MSFSVPDFSKVNLSHWETPRPDGPKCPITNESCDKEQCGWWSEDSQKCAVLVAAESLKKGVKK